MLKTFRRAVCKKWKSKRKTNRNGVFSNKLKTPFRLKSPR